MAGIGNVLTRTDIEQVARRQAQVYSSFADGDAKGIKDFLKEITRLMNKISAGEKITIGGLEIDPNTPQGAVVLQMHIQNVQAERDIMQGLAKLGLRIEKEAWKH